ncbi:UPF0481 protein At3g47200-like [Gastrolobium bilobum]|uniref:UPF0481 protein At3g47200-like n=1 Tax=Gastrolobium bilobum TaxID=150636 RepID=UPI002AB20D19|nr:UPF0481 protein At3g47200-like [Gastrolobium bilobum]
MAHANTSFALSDAEFERVKHIIDIRDLEDFKLSECSIYKVPCNLRKVNEEAYTPQLISIGPIHLGKEELKPMQEHKKRYFHFFWERVSNELAMMYPMDKYKDYLKTQEQEIKQCYAQKFPKISDEKFLDMMLLDAVFIMELFLRHSSWKSDTIKPGHDNVERKSSRFNHSGDYILSQSWLSKDIARDLILIENQIPIFVLKELYDTVVSDVAIKKEHPCFVDLALQYFALYDTQRSSSGSDETKLVLEKNLSKKHFFSGSIFGFKKPLNKSMTKDRCKNPEHFTDLIRYFCLPANMRNSGRPDNVLRTATKLQESGVSFEKDKKRRLLEISFDKKPFLSSFLCLGCLQHLNHFKARFVIPQLEVGQTTECVVRNLIAFEQCHYPEQPYICNYVSLIDSLIHTQVDVELLVEKEVIVHELGSDEEVATLVNGLCKHVVTNSTCYYETINELNKHYQNVWNRTMAALWLVYFRDTWRASSTVVGIAVLIFAVFNFLRVVRYLF